MDLYKIEGDLYQIFGKQLNQICGKENTYMEGFQWHLKYIAQIAEYCKFLGKAAENIKNDLIDRSNVYGTESTL